MKPKEINIDLFAARTNFIPSLSSLADLITYSIAIGAVTSDVADVLWRSTSVTAVADVIASADAAAYGLHLGRVIAPIVPLDRWSFMDYMEFDAVAPFTAPSGLPWFRARPLSDFSVEYARKTRLVIDLDAYDLMDEHLDLLLLGMVPSFVVRRFDHLVCGQLMLMNTSVPRKLVPRLAAHEARRKTESHPLFRYKKQR